MDGAALLAAFGGSAASAVSAGQTAARGATSPTTEWVQFNGVIDSFPVRGPEVRK